VKPVLTAEEYSRVDQAYEGDLAQAMDRAGYSVALAAVNLGVGYGSRVAVLAGPGNNGGDGYVAARYLKNRGANPVVYALSPPKTALTEGAAADAADSGVRIVPLGEPVDCDLVIDAVFGGAARGGMPAEVLAWMSTDAPVVSVDYPTGMDPNTGQVEEQAFRATTTVTFGTLKTSHLRGRGPDYCGGVMVADIGIEGGEPCMFVAEEEDARRPARQRTDHKWSAGSVLVVGGSKGMTGAAVLAGRGALSFGAGSVAVASPLAERIASVAPELLTFELNEMDRLARFDVAVVGPGLAAGDLDSVLPILQLADQVVLDAGALTPEVVDLALAGDSSVIVTPHSSEFERMSGLESGVFSTRAFARKRDLTVLLKGNPTLISDGSLPVLVNTGGKELASIGTGDVLAGMVGALWARGLDPLDSAISGAYWHGLAGAALAADTSVTADRLAEVVGAYAW
jgi:hydroxyethylthiazole kinase-like uncharacterized protein yjeF